MTLLLDTHVWLWRLLEPERLSARATKAIDAAGDAVHLSPVSVWETLVLARRGRLRLSPAPQAWVRQALQRSPVTMAPVTHDVAMRSEALDGLKTIDPVDRILVATAIENHFVLVTADQTMRKYKDVETLW